MLGVVVPIVFAMCFSTCSAPPAKRPAPVAPSAAAPAAPPRAVGARIAYAGDKAICVRGLGRGGMGEEACTKLADDAYQFSWLPGGDIAVLTVSRRAFVAGPRGTRVLPLPPDSVWTRPPPLDRQGNLALGAGPRSDKWQLSVRANEVWLASCPWWFIFDAGWCHEWVSVRLDPWAGAPEVKVEQGDPPGLGEKEEPQFQGTKPPPAVTLLVEPAADASKPPRLVCQKGAARGVFAPDEDGSRISIGWTWIPDSESMYLATVTHDFGEGERLHTFLMKACDDQPEMEIERVVVGPRGFWGHRAEDAWVVRHGDRAIGKIPATEGVFEP